MAAGAEIARLFATIGADVTGLTKGLATADSKLNQAAGKMKSVGKTLTMGVTAPILGAAAAAVKLGVDLDREMRNIQSVSKGTDAEIGALADTFVDMSTDITKTTDSAVGLAQGFYDIQGSGFAGADAMMVLEASTMAASAGLTSTEVAAKAVSSVLNAYGAEAESAGAMADLLFRTVDVGVGTFEELSNAIGYVVGTASQAGIGFDEVSAALATASKQGISFDKGARALNMLLLAFIKPSEDMAAALQSIGYESGQAAMDALGLGGTLQALEAAGYGGTEGLASLGLSSMALRGALALTGEGADMFAGDLDAMKTASEGAGATQDAFYIQTESVAMQLENAANKAAALGLGFREVLLPALLSVLDVAGGWLDKLLAMDDHTKKVVVVVLALAAALGPVLIVVGQIMTAIAALTPIITAVGTVIGVLLSPIGLVVAAIVALALAWKNNWFGIQEKVAFAKEVIGAVFDELVDMAHDVWDGIKRGLSKLGDIVHMITHPFETAINMVNKVLKRGSPSKVFEEIGNSIMDGLKSPIVARGPEIIDALKGLGVNMVAAAQGIADEALTVLEGTGAIPGGGAGGGGAAPAGGGAGGGGATGFALNIGTYDEQAISQMIGSALAVANKMAIGDTQLADAMRGSLKKNVGFYAEQLGLSVSELGDKLKQDWQQRGWDQWFGDMGIGTKDIFGFARGGIVPGPIGRPQLAVVHGGEPIGKDYVGRGAQQRGGDIVINLDGREIARATAPYRADELQRKGVRLLG